MSSTSKKHRNFVSEPMGRKNVNEVPGIGPVLSERLANRGCTGADNLMGQYLVRSGNKEAFCSYLQTEVGANKKQAADAHKGLSEWRDEFM